MADPTGGATEIAKRVLERHGLIGFLLLILIASNIWQLWTITNQERTEARELIKIQTRLVQSQEASTKIQERVAIALEKITTDELRETEFLKLFLQSIREKPCEEINPATDGNP